MLSLGLGSLVIILKGRVVYVWGGGIRVLCSGMQCIHPRTSSGGLTMLQGITNKCNLYRGDSRTNVDSQEGNG